MPRAFENRAHEHDNQGHHRQADQHRLGRRRLRAERRYVVVDRGGRASWYGSWWVGATRVKRKLGLKRTPGNADGLTRTQAERELRRRVDATVVVAQGQRWTIGEAGRPAVRFGRRGTELGGGDEPVGGSNPSPSASAWPSSALGRGIWLCCGDRGAGGYQPPLPYSASPPASWS
jgi:hypothetical protein